MNETWDKRPYQLIAAGVLGIAAYAVAMRLFHPGWMASDLIHGLWYGVCLGIEILGLVMIRKQRGKRATNRDHSPIP
jgi:hypothetical protein